MAFRASKDELLRRASYEYQRLLSYPVEGLNETQTHAVIFFYTLYPTQRISISLFGGPQYSDDGADLASLPLRSLIPGPRRQAQA